MDKNKMIKAINNCHSMAQASRVMGVNYKTFRDYAKKYNIFKPNLSEKINDPTKLISYLNNEKYINSTSLKKLLIKNKILEYKCYNETCGVVDKWLNKNIVLELDHIDGNFKNNSLNNLRLLCPNCHSQTDNWKGRNKNNLNKYSDNDIKKAFIVSKNISEMCLNLNITPKGGNYKTIKNKLNDLNLNFNVITNDNFCKCGVTINKTSKLCYKCSHIKQRKCKRPKYSELLNDINNLGYSGTGRKYGVSDNAIRKWVKYYEKYG